MPAYAPRKADRIEDLDFLSLMGMHEMEEAVRVMIEKSRAIGVPFNLVTVRADDFEGDALTGFCQLLARGWMEPRYPNSAFGPTRDLVERLNERLTDGNKLAMPLTLAQFAERLIEAMP